ncbi:hypothetical protein [Synechococcus phage S-E7]|jgi:hypothetical protein|uniref:Uncharacterized protein n=1 Tax=Synechococcus phage S-P4 TaxID=2484640 RepID=A0A3G3M5X6_9CAUD|nr:hypothetical protein HOU57_gp035 [Synechococcus phage S-P4]AYR01816.1 hypothetical protein [Synechococcus phage S-P4]AYR02190.1 hypothetical protein [Synechococcus phage S-E7]
MITTDDFQLNEYISLDGVEGYITFISNDYITYCICEYDKPRECAASARQPTTQVNVLIFRQRWDDIQRTTRLHQTDN